MALDQKIMEAIMRLGASVRDQEILLQQCNGEILDTDDHKRIAKANASIVYALLHMYKNELKSTTLQRINRMLDKQ